MTDLLSLEDILEIAAGVLPEVQVRDLGLLASAVARPRMTVLGSDAYPSFALQAAALLESLVRNHALVDGNKRLGWAATRTFYLLNGRDLAYESVDAAEAFVLSVARGWLRLDAIAEWLELHEVR